MWQIIQCAWNSGASTCRNEDDFAGGGGRLIIMHNFLFTLKSLLIFTLYLSNWTPNWKGALQIHFPGTTNSFERRSNTVWNTVYDCLSQYMKTDKYTSFH